MPKRQHRWDFFIAHAGADKQASEDLYDLLATKSRVFLDSRCLKLGDDWDVTLPAEQKASFVTVVLVSSKTDRAYYQREEVAAAISLTRTDSDRYRVVPIYLDEGVLSGDLVPYGLRLKHGLQLSGILTMAKAAVELQKLLTPGMAKQVKSSKPPSRLRQRSGILHQPPQNWVSPVRSSSAKYKLVAFDLDGTLIRGNKFAFSWEIVWQELGFGKEIQNKLKREYRQKTLPGSSRASQIEAYRQWCQKATELFKERNLTRDQLMKIGNPLTLTQNCREALAALRAQGIVIAIISGGISSFLENKFSDFRDYVDFVFINQFKFSPTGLLVDVIATDYDFQGKAEALELVKKRVGCTSAETVFVGDRFNDEAVMLEVGMAIAYPPNDSVTEGASHVSVAEDNLMAILDYVLVP